MGRACRLVRRLLINIIKPGSPLVLEMSAEWRLKIVPLSPWESRRQLSDFPVFWKASHYLLQTKSLQFRNSLAMTVDMSTATEVKLLTLLNVSAVKRPRELDLPGGHRSSPSLKGTSTQQNSEDGEPKKRKKSVIWGGEVGPSGSDYLKDNSKKRKEKAKKKAVGMDETLANSDAVKVVEVDEMEVYDGQSGGEEEDLTSGRLTSHLTNLLMGNMICNTDLFNIHFSAAPPILTPEALSSAEGNQWKSERKNLKGFGRVVELTPEQSTFGFAEEQKTRVSTLPHFVVLINSCPFRLLLLCCQPSRIPRLLLLICPHPCPTWAHTRISIFTPSTVKQTAQKLN